MIKQQQRVIKKGEYYQMQTYQQTMMLISKTKKDQQQNSTSNIPVNEHITTEVPSWTGARDNYFSTQIITQYSSQGVDELIDELTRIGLYEYSLRDQDRKEIEMLIEEISEFAHSQEIQLNSLQSEDIKKEKAKPTQAQHTSINLTAKYNIANISERILKLQSLDFPELVALQHQLQIMLGEKKPLQSLQLSHMDQKQKEQLTNLYNHLNSLSIMNNTQRVIDSVFMNEGKHVEMQRWLEKMESIQAINTDLLVEMRQDQEIFNKLQSNFEANVKKVRQILTELKSQK